MNPEHRQLIDRIRSSAAELQRAAARVPAGKDGKPPREGEWSVRETLIHLRNVVCLVQGLRIRRLLYETDPVFADFDEAAFRRADLEKTEPIDDLVHMIAAEHEQVARLLATLPDARWQRQGRHPELGPMSIEFLARRLGEHTAEHAAQVVDTAATL